MVITQSGRSLTILVHEWVTGGGLSGSPLPASWAAEGQAMRRAIAADFASISDETVDVIVTLDRRLPDDPGPWRIERIGEGEGAERVLNLAVSCDFTIPIAPETAGILAALVRDLDRVGARALACTAAAVELTADKARLADWLESAGINTPPTRIIDPSKPLPPAARYPAVLKPVDGAGSTDTFYLSGPGDLPTDANAMRAAVLQPFVPGLPMSASFLMDRDGRASLIGVGRQHMEIRGSRFRYLGGTIPAPCPGATGILRRAVESIAGLRGFVGVDFVWDSATCNATVLEINPRPTTSYVGLSRLLPPGCLARAWIDKCAPRGNLDRARPVELAEIVHGRRPLSFAADGATVVPFEGV